MTTTRLAVIFGNLEYQDNYFRALKNPGNDAKDVEKALKLLGFDAKIYINKELNEMLTCLGELLDIWKENASEIIVFYSGHGVSIGGKLFLVPVDAKYHEDEFLFKKSLFGLEEMIDFFLRSRRNSEIPIIFIVDCCRSEGSSNTHASEGPLQITRNHFGHQNQNNIAILFSTSGGEVALDNYKDSEHSPFTEFLLQNIPTNKTLTEIDMAIRNHFGDIDGKQMPCIFHNLQKHYRFKKINNSPERIVFPRGFINNKFFVDRPKVFGAINDAIERNRKSPEYIPVVLCGLGGMGKSQIALEFCRRNKDQYHIFWMAADTEKSLKTSFEGAATLLGLTSTPVELLKWLETNKEWLLIFDNADDLSLWKKESEGYCLWNKYFPKTIQGVIMITTCIDVANDGELIKIKMDEFEMDDNSALNLMLRKDVTTVDTELALKIVRKLGHLPLAVHLAGETIRDPGMSSTKYLEKYKQERLECLKYKDDNNPYGKTVFTAWDVPFNLLKEMDSLAANLLLSIAFLEPNNIPFILFHTRAQLNSDKRENLISAIKLLCKFSLLRRTVRQDIKEANPARETYTIHRLVQKVIILKLSSKQKKVQQCQWLITALRRAVSHEFSSYQDLNFLKSIEVFVPHIIKISRLFAKWKRQNDKSEDLTPLLSPAVIYHTRKALLNVAERLAKEAISNINRQELDTATAYSNLFYVYVMQREFSKAEEHGLRALKLRKKKLGIRDNLTRSSLHYLAYVYDILGKSKDATLLFEEASSTANDNITTCEMARRYLHGIGTEKDLKKGNELNTKVRKLPNNQFQCDFYEYGRIDFTPLHHAVQCDDSDGILKSAEEHWRFANVGDNDGKTPLHHAAEKGHIEITKLLVYKLGADMCVKDKNQWTPLRCALEREHDDVAHLLFAELYEKISDFKGQGIGGGRIHILVEFLKKNTVITHLNLTDNEIGDKGVYYLAKFLKQNITLSQLTLKNNKIGNEGLRSLAECLKENKALTYLNLAVNAINDKEIQYLTECLNDNRVLSHLDLSSNIIGANGARILAKSLKKITSLTQLDLEFIDLGDGGAKALAEYLNDTNLTRLNISYNNIDFEGNCALFESLKNNVNVTQLNLEGTNIGAEGVRFLVECLKENRTLTKLNLACNLIGDEGARSLTEFLNWTTLTQLDLRCNEISFEEARLLVKSSKKNSHFIELHFKNQEKTEGVIRRMTLNIARGNGYLGIENRRMSEVKEINETNKMKIIIAVVNLLLSLIPVYICIIVFVTK